MWTPAKLAIGLLVASSLAVPAVAEARGGGWKRSHPARVQINKRIAFQQHRITHERRQGDLTQPQALALRKDLHEIRLQERAYARANDNNGHLTREQIRSLNQELNQTSQAIGH